MDGCDGASAQPFNRAGQELTLPKTLVIDGRNIRNIPSFYDEMNRVFMADEDWKLGASLDALNDMFYGGYGAIKREEPVILVWQGMAQNRVDLGMEATRKFYSDKLNTPELFNHDHARNSLEKLENGTGQTYFDIVLEIIADHPNIELRPS